MTVFCSAKESVQPTYDWAEHLADLLGRAIVFCSNDALREEVDQILRVYYKGVDPSRPRVMLRTLIEVAAKHAEAEGQDPYEMILRVIASRAQDLDEHMDDDRDVYEDIKAWLNYEAEVTQEEYDRF